MCEVHFYGSFENKPSAERRRLFTVSHKCAPKHCMLLSVWPLPGLLHQLYAMTDACGVGCCLIASAQQCSESASGILGLFCPMHGEFLLSIKIKPGELYLLLNPQHHKLCCCSKLGAWHDKIMLPASEQSPAAAFLLLERVLPANEEESEHGPSRRRDGHGAEGSDTR